MQTKMGKLPWQISKRWQFSFYVGLEFLLDILLTVAIKSRCMSLHLFRQTHTPALIVKLLAKDRSMKQNRRKIHRLSIYRKSQIMESIINKHGNIYKSLRKFLKPMLINISLLLQGRCHKSFQRPMKLSEEKDIAQTKKMSESG